MNTISTKIKFEESLKKNEDDLQKIRQHQKKRKKMKMTAKKMNTTPIFILF
jgi:hypothetical protein